MKIDIVILTLLRELLSFTDLSIVELREIYYGHQFRIFRISILF